MATNPKGKLPKNPMTLEAMARLANVAKMTHRHESDRRIMENTPCLKELYEFLARPLPGVTQEGK